MNIVTLLGRIGSKDLNGEVLKLSIATDESYTNKDGERVKQSEWHRVVVFGKQSEIVNKFFHKGDGILLTGKLKTSKYEKDGQDHYSTDIHLKTFEFLPTKKSESVNDTQDTAKNGVNNKDDVSSSAQEVDNLPF